LVDDLHAAIATGCDGPGLREITQWCSDLFEHFRGAEAIVVNKQQAAGLRASNDADCYGAAGLDLSDEIATADGVFLPFRLIGALVVADGYECPVIRDIGELIEEFGYHMDGERPAKFGR
jgi:hypothetical protein